MTENDPINANALLTIDLDALAENYTYIRHAAQPAQCGAAVKADAYGLGLRPVARTLAAAGCRVFFVATLQEGADLREILPAKTQGGKNQAEYKIYVFEGPQENSVDLYGQLTLIPVLNSLEQIRSWTDAAYPTGNMPEAALHIDSGMARLGLSADDVRTLSRDQSLLARLNIGLIMTHLSSADNPDDRASLEQVKKFDSLRKLLPAAPTSIGNSAGSLLGEAYRGDLVRPGIALYGGAPFPGRANPMKEVVHLQAKILQCRQVGKDTPVGYSQSYRTTAENSQIITVGIGYGDGYPRSLSNKGLGLIGQDVVPVAGIISMDLTTFDVSHLPAGKIQPGDRVTLIGKGIGLTDVARNAGTISYDILTGLKGRIQKIYKGIE